ncbi:MAG: zinc ribbon domain-containing protein [Methanobrevibacter sp.]|jgi:DNA-directed RNA polymerase subunit M/transcription elongation factor TFIIS|nr:zinc ribbon domain-containing protein [Candidatus Methanoflexus mossambicus]
MRYENVSDSEELNFRVNQYINDGYKVEFKDEKQATVVKSKFSVGIFILLLILIIIGGLIYLAIRYGKKDIVVIQVKGTSNQQQYTLPQTENIECSKCGYKNESASKFCLSCGNDLTMKNEEQTIGSKTCPKCGEKNLEDSKFCSGCGTELKPDYHSTFKK